MDIRMLVVASLLKLYRLLSALWIIYGEMDSTLKEVKLMRASFYEKKRKNSMFSSLHIGVLT